MAATSLMNLFSFLKGYFNINHIKGTYNVFDLRHRNVTN